MVILEHPALRTDPGVDVIDATGLDAGERLRSPVLPVGLRPGRPGARKGREIRYRLVNGVDELLAAADGVVAMAGQTIGACPNFGSDRTANST